MMKPSISHYVKTARTRLHRCGLVISTQIEIKRKIQDGDPITCRYQIHNSSCKKEMHSPLKVNKFSRKETKQRNWKRSWNIINKYKSGNLCLTTIRDINFSCIKKLFSLSFFFMRVYKGWKIDINQHLEAFVANN